MFSPGPLQDLSPMAEGCPPNPQKALLFIKDLEINRRACPQIDMQTGSRFRARSVVPELWKHTAMWHEPTRAKPPLLPLRAAFLWAISVAPSPQRPPKSSFLAGAASFGHGTGDALGGASRCRLAQHGGNHGQRRQRFSAVLLYGIIRHGDCRRGREPAHLMQPLCLATLLGQCVQVRENVAGD